MKPALLLIVDPAPGEAVQALDRMLAAWGVGRSDCAAAAGGEHFAAVAIPPAASEPTCGVDVLDIGTDMLIWAGEMFIPPSWFDELEETDRLERMSAAVLQRLRTHGLEAIAEIDGGFCGAWLDRQARRWFIFNDKLGQVPMFWSADGDRLVVSPKAWLTWRGMDVSLQISEQGVADLIRTQNMCADHTLIQNVQWLPRGQALCWGEEGAGYCRYWDFDYAHQQIEHEQHAIDLYLERMEASIRRHASSDAPLLLGISGGLDSRIFLALCERVGCIPQCFTSGWPFYEDVRFGRKVARVARASHELAELRAEQLSERLEELILDSDGLQSAAHFAPATATREFLRNHAGAVLLEGFYNGLVGGGAVPADEDVARGVVPHESRWVRRMLHSGGDPEVIERLLKPRIAYESYDRWSGRIDGAFRRAPFSDPLSRAEYAMVHARLGRAEMIGTSLLRSQVLVRNPASDLQMLDWHQRVSPRLRRGRRLYLSLLRREFPRYANVPRADGCGALPISTGRGRREYCWQAARIHRWYAGLRYPMTRRWGMGSGALRAWAFDVWKESGRLDMLLESDARVLSWVRRDSLLESWKAAETQPAHAQLLLTLATVETAVRALETHCTGGINTTTDFILLRAETARRKGRVKPALAGSAA